MRVVDSLPDELLAVTKCESISILVESINFKFRTAPLLTSYNILVLESKMFIIVVEVEFILSKIEVVNNVTVGEDEEFVEEVVSGVNSDVNSPENSLEDSFGNGDVNIELLIVVVVVVVVAVVVEISFVEVNDTNIEEEIVEDALGVIVVVVVEKIIMNVVEDDDFEGEKGSVPQVDSEVDAGVFVKVVSNENVNSVVDVGGNVPSVPICPPTPVVDKNNGFEVVSESNIGCVVVT